MLIRIRACAAACSVAVLAALAGGCGSGAPSASTPSTGSSATQSSAPTPSGTAASGCDTAPWRSAPVSVTHAVSVPPVPVLTAVRVAQHPECGYDRIVLDITGPLPSYSVRYVDHVIADPSGQVVSMPGVRYLQITLRPAQAHSDAGAATVTAGVRRPGFPALTSWALAGDFEGVVNIALGLTGQVSMRTGELPGRIYIDVKE